ncbi:DUF2892 domain-containing protein [Pseudomonadales bacterium]|nr:DUF2892 domain-containing protein [Pseudomonadales bacterium]
MIETNIGNVERVLRLIIGVSLAGWFMLQPHLNGIEWFIFTVSTMLVLNGVFSRCYLWYVLDINTRKKKNTAYLKGAESNTCF